MVVADNCADDTAARARERGATVLERDDPKRWGKGYALLHALEAIAAEPPDVVLMIDGDSTMGAGLVGTLSRAAASARRPIQAAYLPQLPRQPRMLDRLSALAFVTKNVTRPTGLARLGLPCLLTGTGMAFPWTVIRAAPIAGDRTAEDMRLAVDLSIAGYPPSFCPEALIAGPLAPWKEGPTVQRTRWEHGHLETLAAGIGPLLGAAIRDRRPELLALALELGVPPLSLWALLWTIATTLSLVLIVGGGSGRPLGVLLTGGLFAATAVLIAWARDGRSFVPARMLGATAWYVVRKLPVYATFPWRRHARWAAASAGPPDGPAAAPTGHGDAAAPTSLATVTIGGLCDVHSVSEADVVHRVIDRLAVGEGGWIVTLNIDHLWHLERNPEYAALCARATVAVADGITLVWSSRLQGTPLPERVAGADLISSLSAAAAHHEWSIFLMGGMPGTADGAAAALQARHPELRVAGVLSECDGWDPEDIAARLRAARADIVYVSLGKIAEERLIDRLRERLPGTWFMGVGTSFAFLSGQVRRAPHWMREGGLEWVHRWAQEPARLTGRYLRSIPLAIRLLGAAVVRRARSRRGWRSAPR